MGDDLIENNKLFVREDLPKNFMTCDETMSYLSSIGLSPIGYCFTSKFSKACCDICKSKNHFHFIKIKNFNLWLILISNTKDT